MRLNREEWTIGHLRAHLQYAVDLEFWTIPFYISAMYSIRDRTCAPFQLIQSIVNQEMLHVQLISNVANAFGLSPTFRAPVYEGQRVPHLSFALDTPNPTHEYSPFSAEIGPLDDERINAMCLIEYPEWKSSGRPDLRDDVTEYGSIGEFYDAVAYGAAELKEHVHGGVNQVDFFSPYYAGLPSLTVQNSGSAGFREVSLLINVIREQGEGATARRTGVPTAMQNTADDTQPAQSHFTKFSGIRAGQLPDTYLPKPANDYGARDEQLQQTLAAHFRALREALTALFAGRNPEDFVRHMISVGASIQNCWKHSLVPRFEPGAAGTDNV